MSAFTGNTSLDGLKKLEYRPQQGLTSETTNLHIPVTNRPSTSHPERWLHFSVGLSVGPSLDNHISTGMRYSTTSIAYHLPVLITVLRIFVSGMGEHGLLNLRFAVDDACGLRHV